MRKAHLVARDFGDQAAGEVMVVARMGSAFVPGIVVAPGKLDPVSVHVVDSADMGAVRADHFHVLLNLRGPVAAASIGTGHVARVVRFIFAHGNSPAISELLNRRRDPRALALTTARRTRRSTPKPRAAPVRWPLSPGRGFLPQRTRFLGVENPATIPRKGRTGAFA
jgi:hypothetical protein